MGGQFPRLRASPGLHIYLSNDSYLGKHTAMSTIRPANTHNEILLLVQAAASGKKLQASRRADKVEAWGDMTNPNFNFMDFRYRVKPTPVERFAIVSDSRPFSNRFSWPTRESAERALRMDYHKPADARVIRMVEAD